MLATPFTSGIDNATQLVVDFIICLTSSTFVGLRRVGPPYWYDAASMFLYCALPFTMVLPIFASAYNAIQGFFFPKPDFEILENLTLTPEKKNHTESGNEPIVKEKPQSPIHITLGS